MFTWLNDKVDGYRTYIALWGGVLIAGIGCFMGGADMGGITIPTVDPKMFVEALWAAVVGTFFRKAVAKTEIK